MDGEAYLDNPLQIISAELLPKEKLLWSGHPALGLRLHVGDVFLIPFSLMWGGAVIGATIGAAIRPTPLFARIIIIPFFLVGVWLIVGRFFVEAYVRGHTFYGITSERIIIITGLFRRRTISLDIQKLGGVTITENRSGKALIEFGVMQSGNSRDSKSSPWMPAYYTSRFVLPEDGRKVFDIIRSVEGRGR